MFNPEIKNEFMLKYKKETKDNFLRIFKVSNEIEKDLNKDLFKFSREEIRRMMFLFQPKTEYSSRNNLTLVKNYIDWSINNGYLVGISPLSGITNDWLAQFVVPSSKKYWTEDEMFDITSPYNLENAQDAIVPMLKFYGLGGQGNNEILNLQEQDINEALNMLHVKDTHLEKERNIYVPTKVIKLCQAALRETDYVKSNGNPKKTLKAKVTAKLVENSFIVKSSRTKTYHLEDAEKNIVYRRFEMIQEMTGLPHFTPNNISYSGMIFKAYQLFNERGGLGDREYDEVFEQFGTESIPVQNRNKSEFLNLDTIKKLYDPS